MRNQSSLAAAPTRSQAQIMDETWLYHLALQIAGECCIAWTTEMPYDEGEAKRFAEKYFQEVLHKVALMQPRTLGRVVAHGLNPSMDAMKKWRTKRRTPMCWTWFGTVESTVSGILLLEWSATAVVLAAIFDIISERVADQKEADEAYKDERDANNW